MEHTFLRDIKTSFFAILFIFLGLFLYNKFVGPIPLSISSVTTTKTDVFTTTGEGKAAAAPDRTEVSIGITSTRTTVKEAQSEANGIINAVTDELKTLGVDNKDIQTTNYNIYPNYDFEAGQRITGYTVSTNISVKAPIDRANDVIDAATQHGANVVSGVQFTFSDEMRTKLEDKARKEAVDEAKQKADKLANASGIQLGKIINVQENSTNAPIAFRTMMVGGDVEQKSETNISPGENTVEITITLSYETY